MDLFGTKITSLKRNVTLDTLTVTNTQSEVDGPLNHNVLVKFISLSHIKIPGVIKSKK